MATKANGSPVGMPAEVGVIIEDLDEVPADIWGPAERAALAASKKETRSIPLAFARAETEEEVSQREYMATAPAMAEAAENNGVSVEEAVFYFMCAGPLADSPQRVPLDCEAFFSPSIPAVIVRADLDRGHWEQQESIPLEWLSASLTAEAYRRALWQRRGLEKMAKRGQLKSADRYEDCRIYAANMVKSNLPW